MEGTEQATQTENNEAAEAQLSLGAQDLNTYANIIKVAIERGAFKAEEVSQVGAAYDKLTAFLQSITPPPEANVDPKRETEAPAATEGANTDAAQ